MIRVGSRFNGPPASGNGGWTAGLVAEAVGSLGAVRVSLTAPPPLERDLALGEDPEQQGRWLLCDGETLVATAVAEHAPGEHPGPAVAPDAARAAEAAYAGHRSHPFPTCFVCGPERAPGDGLRIFPGRLDDDRVASGWSPDPGLTGPDGRVGTPLLWAALDCVGGWSSDIEHRPMVLASMGAALEPGAEPPVAGQEYAVVGRRVGTEGRKTWTVSGLYDDQGRLRARAQHLWIEVRRP